MRHFLILCLVVMLSVVGAAYAQDKAPAAAAPPAASSDPDYAKKLELAHQMHQIRPAKAQVQEAVDQVSKTLSPADRDSFNKIVEKAFDYDRLEKLSTDTMVDLFTVGELQKMVDYFGSPEAKSISQKLPKYQAKIQPEIIRMLDAAMLAQRTGGSTPPPNTKTAPADKPDGNAPAPVPEKAPEKPADPVQPKP